MNGGGSERGRHRIRNRLQALSCQHKARRGARTHGPRDRDLAEVGRLTDCATQAPLMFIFEREREREGQGMSGGGAGREGDSESKAGSMLRAVSTAPYAGFEPTNREIMIGAEVRWLTD